MRIGRLLSICVLSLLCVSSGQAGVIDLTAPSILVGQIGFPSSNAVYQFSINGTHTNSLLLGFSGLLESLTVLNNELFVSDSSGNIRQIDPGSGNVLSIFGSGIIGLNGLGTYQSNVLALGFSSTAVSVYSSSGILQTTISLTTLPTGFDWDGVTSDGTSLFLADDGTDRIYQYSIGGTLLGSFNPGILGLSGIAYDVLTNSLWVDSSSTPGVYEFSKTGTLLGSFLTPGITPDAGIAVLAGTPEPASWWLVMGAFVLFLPFRLSTRIRGRRRLARVTR